MGVGVCSFLPAGQEGTLHLASAVTHEHSFSILCCNSQEHIQSCQWSSSLLPRIK